MVILCISANTRDVNEFYETQKLNFFSRSLEINLLNSENRERLTITPVAPLRLLSVAYQQAYNDCYVSVDASTKQRKLTSPCQCGCCRD